MSNVDVLDPAGQRSGSVELDPAVFGLEPNTSVMAQVVTAQLAARRAGTQSTKTRSESRGGGAKPWAQKGTGRARAGSSRSPIWRGGGVALGPKPRSYVQKTPKKMVRLALRSALSDRAADGKVTVVDAWGWDVPSTKSARRALEALGVTGRILVVLGRDDDVAARSFRNLPEVHVLSVGELNAYDVLVSDHVIFTRATLPGSVPAPAGRAGSPTAAAPAPSAEGATPAPEAAAPSAAGTAPTTTDTAAPTAAAADASEDTQ